MRGAHAAEDAAACRAPERFQPILPANLEPLGLRIRRMKMAVLCNRDCVKDLCEQLNK